MRRILSQLVLSLLLITGSSRSVLGKGSQVVFVSTEGMSGPKLYVMNEDGTNVHRVGALPGWYGRPAFSPDNRKIVFSYATDFSSPDGLYIMNVDGSAPTQLPEAEGWAGQFTRDGRIVYSRGDASFVMNIDGSGRARLSINATGLGEVSGIGVQPRSAAFGPQGLIAFVAPMNVGGYEQAAQLFTMGADGHGLKRLTTSIESAAMPAWSPDGKKIAFANVGAWPLAMSGLKPHHENDGIYMISADGTKLTRLVQVDFGQDLGPSSFGIGPGRDIPGLSGAPSFNADGGKLVFAVRFGSRACVISIVNVDGTGLRRLTEQSGFNCEPSFSH